MNRKSLTRTIGKVSDRVCMRLEASLFCQLHSKPSRGLAERLQSLIRFFLFAARGKKVVGIKKVPSDGWRKKKESERWSIIFLPIQKR
jgi:hypothetical protein